MDMEIITRVREQLGEKLACPDVGTSHIRKSAAAQKAFVEMVRLNGVDSRELFDRIHRCFEEHSLRRPYHDWYHTWCVIEGTTQGLRHLLRSRLPNFPDDLPPVAVPPITGGARGSPQEKSFKNNELANTWG